MELTSDLLIKIAKLPKKVRGLALAKIGQYEFEKCADDPLYWIDSSKHVKTKRWPNGLPYVFTKDPHDIYECLACHIDVPDNVRAAHLEIFHNEKPPILSKVLRDSFKKYPAIRPFSVLEYMPPLIRSWVDSQYFALEKSRDMMATWLMIAMSTWDCMFHAGRQHIFQSQDAGKSLELVTRAKIIYENSPNFLKKAIGGCSFKAGGGRSGEIYFTDQGSEILGFPQGPEQIRQYHPSCIFMDEAAFQQEAGAAFAAIKPAIMMGGKAVMISSANRSYFELICRDKSDT